MGYSTSAATAARSRRRISTCWPPGLRFTQFYNCAKCAQTRASLLTGHCTTSAPRRRSMTRARPSARLRDAGYRTLIAGKWHPARCRPRAASTATTGWPTAAATSSTRAPRRARAKPEPGARSRGATLGHRRRGDHGLHRPSQGLLHHRRLHDLRHRPYLDEYKGEDKPFLLYLPYTAPHYPLHAWPEDIAKYRGKYQGRLGRDPPATLRAHGEDGRSSTRRTGFRRARTKVPAWESCPTNRRTRRT